MPPYPQPRVTGVTSSLLLKGKRAPVCWGAPCARSQGVCHAHWCCCGQDKVLCPPHSSHWPQDPAWALAPILFWSHAHARVATTSRSKPIFSSEKGPVWIFGFPQGFFAFSQPSPQVPMWARLPVGAGLCLVPSWLPQFPTGCEAFPCHPGCCFLFLLKSL